MGLYEDHREEIAHVLTSMSHRNWSIFVEAMKNVIINSYKGEDLEEYKQSWKAAFNKSLKQLNLRTNLSDPRSDVWRSLIFDKLNTLTEATTSTSSSMVPIPLSPYYTPADYVQSSSDNFQLLYNTDFLQTRESFSRITNKWQLATSNRFVEDVIFAASNKMKYVHSAHSMILNIEDTIWNQFFNEQEREEISGESLDQDLNNGTFSPDSEELLRNLIDKTRFIQIYYAFDTIPVNPADENKELYWLKTSVLDYANLFIDRSDLSYKTIQEDFFYSVYRFILNSNILSKTKVEVISSLGTNHIIFKKAESNTVLGYVHVDLTPRSNYNKSYDNVNIKLKRYLQDIIEENDINPNGIRVVGIIINGMEISARVLSCSRGSVSVVSTLGWFDMPKHVSHIPALLPLTLRLVLNCAQIMNQTWEHIQFARSNIEERGYFPPCLEPYAEN